MSQTNYWTSFLRLLNLYRERPLHSHWKLPLPWSSTDFCLKHQSLKMHVQRRWMYLINELTIDRACLAACWSFFSVLIVHHRHLSPSLLLALPALQLIVRVEEINKNPSSQTCLFVCSILDTDSSTTTSVLKTRKLTVKTHKLGPTDKEL